MRYDSPPPEPLASAVGFLLSWNGQRMAHMFAGALEPLGLRPPHFGLMTLIDANPGRTQQELVQGSMIDPSSMVAILDELQELGLVERRQNPSDRRKHAVHLTKQGASTLAEARKAAIGIAAEALAPLDDDEREELRLLLRKLAGVGAEAKAPS
ncbi:MAG: MarR family winged helix-turn-helix transcriptional regulator [Solirubrobacterales bacterium]